MARLAPQWRCTPRAAFDRGERIGEWAQWHENGGVNPWCYLNGERSGRWEAWYRNGARKSLGVYVKGPIGRWVYWNDSGVSLPNHTFTHPEDAFPLI